MTFIYCAATAQSGPTIVWESDKAVAVRFHYEGDEKAIKISLTDNTAFIFGRASRQGLDVLFRPVVPFTTGEKYEIWDENGVLNNFEVENSEVSIPEIASVYPSVDTLPANQLKIYIMFNQPMRPDGVYDHIYVTDEAERVVPGAILPLEPALWNHDNTVLTLWFDPGRIKRDLGPNRMMGNPLKPNSTYTLFVDKEISSASGVALRENHTKSYSTRDFDRKSPDLDQWVLEVPKAGGKSILLIRFDEVMDYGALIGKFTVRKGSQNISGRFDVLKGETGIAFTPDAQWIWGDYLMTIDPSVEDLAGNNLERLFDEDTSIIKTQLKKSERNKKFTIQ